jgi:8-oxo-dGTP pyrophosphatase MutT (NUDIX family)
VTHSKQIVFENPWFKVETAPVTTPGGTPATYGVVRFQNRAVGVIPYENGKIWLVGQTRYPFDDYSWEIPEGGVPKDEDMADAARRELKEETGLSADTLTHLLDFQLSNSITDERGTLFLARGLTQGETDLEPSEDITGLTLSLEDLLHHIDTGAITDAITIMAAYKLRLMQLSGELD